jgi:hypothetical protein
VFGSCPRQTVNVPGTAMGVGLEMGVSWAVGVTVTSGCEKGSPQAMMAMVRIKTNNINGASLFAEFMDTSFFEESIYSVIY